MCLTWIILTWNNEFIGTWTLTSSVEPCLRALAIWSSWITCTFFHWLLVVVFLLLRWWDVCFVVVQKKKMLISFFFISLLWRLCYNFKHVIIFFSFLCVVLHLIMFGAMSCVCLLWSFSLSLVDETKHARFDVVCCREWF